MISRAELRYIRITPRKFRQIIPIVKGMNAQRAIAVLASVKKKASQYAISLLKSALANAKRVQGVEQSDLYISRLVANCGPTLKRFRAASMGRASSIRKRTSHLIIELDEVKKHKEESKPKAEGRKLKAEKPKVESKKTTKKKE